MSDAEWTKLQGLFQEKQGPLPDLARLAGRQNRALWNANFIFWPIALGEVGFAAYTLWHWRDQGALLNGALVLAVMVGMGLWFVRMQRKLWRQVLESPEETLLRLERHARMMPTASRVGAYTYLGISVFVFVHGIVEAWGHGPLWPALALPATLVLSGLTVAVFYPRWISRIAERKRAKVEALRNELDLRGD